MLHHGELSCYNREKRHPIIDKMSCYNKEIATHVSGIFMFLQRELLTRIQTRGRIIGSTYTSYPRSLPWKTKRPRVNRRAPVKYVECNPLDGHITRRSLPTVTRPYGRPLDHIEDRESEEHAAARYSLLSLHEH